MREYKIFTDSGCDLSYDTIEKLGVGYLGLTCTIDNKEFEDDGGKTLPYNEFYKLIREGAEAKTSQVPPKRFIEEFEKTLKEGKDIFYIAFSSGLSGTYNSSLIAKEELLKSYPDRKIVIIDTKAASSGEGFLVYLACEYKEKGATLEEMEEYIKSCSKRLYHYFTVKDLKHLQKGGRISKFESTLGTMLDIRPVLTVDNEGKLKAIGKCRGNKRVLKELALKIKKDGDEESLNRVFISHSNDLEAVEELIAIFKSMNENIEIVVNYVGIVIGSHTGEGCLAFFFLGKEREI